MSTTRNQVPRTFRTEKRDSLLVPKDPNHKKRPKKWQQELDQAALRAPSQEDNLNDQLESAMRSRNISRNVKSTESNSSMSFVMPAACDF